MKNQNPYKPSIASAASAGRSSPGTKRSAWKWAGYGFVVGAVIPIGLGIYSLWSDAAYHTAHPEVDQYRCGLGGLAVMVAIFIMPPIFGCIGALVGAVLSKLPRIFGD